MGGAINYMTLEQAIKQIVDNWESLRNKSDYGCSYPDMNAAWCAKSDTADYYQVDEEWVGITPEGSIAWAYASGCSCWGGDFKEERFASVKEVTLKHDSNTPKEWEAAIIRFAQTGVMQQL